MLYLELTQCEYDSGCHLVDHTFCVSRAVEQTFSSLRKAISFSKLIWYFRVEREIVTSTSQVVDKPLSSSLCSILTQCFIWFPHKLKKASMIFICCTKTALSLSPYLCYGWNYFFQCCRHLSFCDRSLISSNQHFQFLSPSFGEIYDLISAAMIWSRVPETTLQPEANLSSV